MPDEVVMVTSCPLCLGADEVESMVTVEIERTIPKGRTAVMLCRNCAGAVIRAAEVLEPPLVDPKVFQLIARAEAPAASEPSEPEDESDVAPEGIER